VARFLRKLRELEPERSVLIEGPRGSGKGYFLQTYEEFIGKELLVINCATIDPGHAESILFGHVEGAFSGAINKREGFIREAELQGTSLFFEELNSLPRAVQLKLLVFLDNGGYKRSDKKTALISMVRDAKANKITQQLAAKHLGVGLRTIQRYWNT